MTNEKGRTSAKTCGLHKTIGKENMNYTLMPFRPEHLEQAVALFVENYRRERENNPLLPSRAIDEPQWSREILQSFVDNPGVAVMDEKQLVAYMVTGYEFPFRGQSGVYVPPCCHGSVLREEKWLYERMYMRLSESWVNNGKHIHIIGHFEHAPELKDTLYELGFGAFLCERIRDLSPLESEYSGVIVQESKPERLLSIHREHYLYYREAPIFLAKNVNEDDLLSDLQSHEENGDVFLVALEQDEPCAYFMVGKSAASPGEAGAMLQGTNTAQIKSAYARKHARGQGVGQALLQQAIRWSSEHGYARLFVEHETANLIGGRFWAKHFSRYLNYSMRYVDNTI